MDVFRGLNKDIERSEEEVGGLRMSRKGRAPPGMDKQKLSSETNQTESALSEQNNVHSEVRNLRVCLLGQVCVSMEETQTLRDKQYKTG